MGDEADYLSSHFDGVEGDSELFNYGDRVFSNRTGNAKIVGCVEWNEPCCECSRCSSFKNVDQWEPRKEGK